MNWRKLRYELLITHDMNEWEHFLNERLEWMIKINKEWWDRMIDKNTVLWMMIEFINTWHRNWLARYWQIDIWLMKTRFGLVSDFIIGLLFWWRLAYDGLGRYFYFSWLKAYQVLYCLVQLDVVLLYLYLLLVGLWHQNMLSLMVTQAAYQMLYHFDKSKTHICYISLIKGAVYSLFLTRCPPIGFTSIKHKGHMPYCLVYQMVWAPIC